MGTTRQAKAPSVSMILAFLLAAAGAHAPAQTQSQAAAPAKAAPAEGGQKDRYVQAWSDVYASGLRKLESFDFEALRRAVRDLAAAFPKQYTKAEDYLRRADAYEKRKLEIVAALKKRRGAALDEVDAIFAFQREALLANPLLDFDELLVVRRKPVGDARRSDAPDFGLGEFLGLPRQSSWQIHAIPQVFGWENEIAVLSSLRGEAGLKTFFRPQNAAPRERRRPALGRGPACCSRCPTTSGLWQVWEIGADGKGLRRVTPGDQPDVHSYDAVYLPNGKINFISTAAFARRALQCRPYGRHDVPDGCRRPEHPADHIRSGPQLQPDRDERRPRAVPALGVHRHTARVGAVSVQHESGRHRPAGLLRERRVIGRTRPSMRARSRTSDQSGGHHHRTSLWAEWGN